jgi:hypothetical protein
VTDLEWTGRRDAAVFGAVFLVVLVVAILTAQDYGIASDVGNYFMDSLRQLTWLRGLGEGLLHGRPGDWLASDTVLTHWRTNAARIPHPPLSRELAGLSYAALRGPLGIVSSYRLPTMTGFALLVAAAGWFVRRGRGSLAEGLGASAAVALTPALFAYGHLALTDMILAVFWFLSVATLETHLRRGGRRWLVASGLLAGAACATKFTGVLLAPVLAGWLLWRGRWTWKGALILAASALAVFLVVNPVMWVEPLRGIQWFVGASVERSEHAWTRIQTYYFGRTYQFRPPWHYPFVWTAVVIPLPILACAGLGAVVDRGGRLSALCGLNLAVLYGAALLPFTPLHDGIRLFLPALPFLCLLAGVGAGWAARRVAEVVERPGRVRAPYITGAVLALVFAPPARALVRTHPYELSYFNGLIGGIRGASARGLEISNLKEVLTPSLLDILAERIPAGAAVDPGFFFEEVCFYQRMGLADPGWHLETAIPALDLPAGQSVWVTCASDPAANWAAIDRSPQPPEYLFVLNRRGFASSEEKALLDRGHPFFRLSLEDVPLMEVFRLEPDRGGRAHD